MTNAEAADFLKFVIRNWYAIEMTDEKAESVLLQADLTSLTVEQLGAVGYAVGKAKSRTEVKNPVQSKWIKTEDQLPESLETILMATCRQGLRAYHVGFYDGNGNWFVRPDLRASSTAILIGPPDYWMEIPEVPE